MTVEEIKEKSKTKPVLLKFEADWCGPCKKLKEIMADMKDEIEPLAEVVIINVDDFPEIAAHYGIRGIPTMLLLKHEQVVNTKVGIHSRTEILEMLK